MLWALVVGPLVPLVLQLEGLAVAPALIALALAPEGEAQIDRPCFRRSLVVFESIEQLEMTGLATATVKVLVRQMAL